MKSFTATNENGFIALISILILSAVLLVTTLSLAQFGIANRFFILDLEQKAASENIAEACIHIARIKAYNDPTYTITTPVSINIAGGSCAIFSVSVSGVNTTIKTRATSGNSTTNLLVVVNNTDGSFVSWEQVGFF